MKWTSVVTEGMGGRKEGRRGRGEKENRESRVSIVDRFPKF